MAVTWLVSAGSARPVSARLGKSGQGLAGLGWAGMAGHGSAGLCVARKGNARLGLAVTALNSRGFA